MKPLIFFCLIQFFVISAFGQEKRLALVIGNANYDKGALKNPVNDALLMKETFQKLGFDVILKTDIETRNDFINVVDEFNEIRANYSIGFIYYAGHGVQIEGDNYLLPTKEIYQTISNLKNKGVNISIFTDEWKSPKNNEINVLILDACRNNPYEKIIYGSSRAFVDNGLGLAEINKVNQPTGSLIAFSTSAGKTAKDGIDNSKNSFYCQRLSEYMLLEDVSIRNVFGKVSKDVYLKTEQYPELSDKMFDVDFFLKKSTYIDQINQIDSLIEEKNYDLALEKVSAIIAKSPNNKNALLRRGRIEYNKNQDYNGSHLFRADSLYPNDKDVLEYLSHYYSLIGQTKNAVLTIDKALKIDSSDAKLYYLKAKALKKTEINKALEAILIALNFDIYNSEYLFLMAQISQEREEDSDIILKYLDQAVALNPKIQDYYFLRSEIFVNKKNFQSAIIDLTEIINIDSTNNLAIKAYAILGEILMNIEKYNESKSFLNKGILYEYKFKEEVSVCYAVRAKLNQIYGEKENVISDYTKAIELCQEGKSDLYNDRGIFYQDSLQNYDMALHDFNLAIKYDSLSWNAFHNKGRLFFLKKNYLDAQKNLLKALEIDQTNILSLNLLGLIYKELKQFQLSIFQYSEGIKHEKSNPKFASYCYLNRADLYILLGKYKDALSDISQAIDLSEKEDKVYAYIQRAYLFIDQLKNYNLALNDFNSAIKISPNQSDLYYDRSNLYFENIKNFDKAIEDLVVFLKYEPNNIDALNQIGLIYEEMNKIEDAIYYYQKGINSKELNSNSKAYCFANLGRLNSNRGNFKDALYFYDKAIEISDTTFKAEFYSERGLLYEEDLKDFDKALVDYSLAIAFNPRDYENWYNRGLLLAKKIHKTEAATYDFLKAHELNPTDLDLLLELTNLLIQLNRINEVENIVYKFESMNQINDSTKANISLIHAIIQRSKNNFSDALDYYNLSIKLMPKVDFFWAQRAWFFIEYLNDLNRGMEDLNKAIELDENNSSYYILRSKIFLKLNDKKNQLNDIESALNNQPNSVYLKTQKAIALSINNETNKSLKLINNAISKDSLNYLFYLCKAKIFLYLKDYVNALELLNKIDTMEPNDPEIDFLKGRIYEFNGEFHNAAFMYLRSENKLNRGDFWINDDFGNEIQKSEFYYMVGKFYEKIKEQALMCKMYNISLDLINKDQLFRLKVIKKEIEEKLNYCQN